MCKNSGWVKHNGWKRWVKNGTEWHKMKTVRDIDRDSECEGLIKIWLRVRILSESDECIDEVDTLKWIVAEHWKKICLMNKTYIVKRDGVIPAGTVQ